VGSHSQILLRWHERQQAWLQIGGHADPGEHDPLEVALREGAEETGLQDLVPWPTPMLHHVVVVPVPANEREPAHEHADLRFLLATRRPDDARPERVTAPLRWLSAAAAAELTTQQNVRETIRRAERLLAAESPTSGAWR
jgi:8-oxo-dGTP pyrophosphatase MutT (NUDIX family)